MLARKRSDRAGLVAGLMLLLTGIAASAAPGPHFRERLAGFIYPDPTDPTTRRAITLDLECRQQDPGDRFCDGRYRCHRAPRLRGFPPPPPPCRERDAKTGFVFQPLDAQSLTPSMAAAGLDEIAFDAAFDDGVTCHFDGVTQDLLVSIRIPAIQGRYECRSQVGAVVESGIFSVELVSFRSLSRFS